MTKLVTLPPGGSGFSFSIPGASNVQYTPTDEPGKYWVSWTEVKKTLISHQHTIDINGQAEIVSSSPASGNQQITAQTLGHQVLAGQTLPSHLEVGVYTNHQSQNAIKVDGTEDNDSISFGSEFAQIIHGNGGDDIIDIAYLNEGAMAIGFLDGGDGNDKLVGGYNGDILIGGSGFNFLQGNAGEDRYIISGSGIDLINPWRKATYSGLHTDIIELPEDVTLDMLTTQYGDAIYENDGVELEAVTLNLNWLGKTLSLIHI